ASKRNLRKKELRTIKKAKIEKSIAQLSERHKTQSETRLSKSKSREYILSYWKSEDFMASDLKSKNDLQSIFLMDPKITFFKKFAERRQQREVIKTLLDRELLPLDAITTTPNHTNYSSHLTTFQILAEFIDLLESEIFDHTKPTNKNSDLAWKQFTLWCAHQQHVKAGKVSLKQTTISEAL
ncbi:15804_t:CDS:2, partial [Racocetra persica]